MINRKVPVQRLEQKHRSHKSERALETAPGREERQSVPAFHMRGLFTVIPTEDVSPLALRLSDVPSDWRDSNAA